MARPRRARIERARQAGLDATRAEAVTQILESLKDYLPDAAKTVGEAARNNVTAATTILKFVAENAPRGSEGKAGEIIAQITALRAQIAESGDADEEEIPEDIDVEAELDGAKVETRTDDANQDLG